MISHKNFKLYIDKNYQTVCKAAALHIVSHVKTTPRSILGLATGDSPKELYKSMVFYSQTMNVSFSKVLTFNLDEYIGLEENSKDSYQFFMNEHLFKHLDIDLSHTHFPLVHQNIETSLRHYQTLLETHSIDIQILGIGTNGHIGFNEPGTPFNSKTHIANLTESTLKNNQKHFKDQAHLPSQAMTMGIDEIMRAKKIMLFASGKHKKKPIDDMVNGPISIDFPASILQTHPNVELYLDLDAAEDLLKLLEIE